MNRKNIWIFTSVIDHFGDIGIAYRLARELAKNQYFNICLWTDSMPTLCSIEPSLSNNSLIQTVHGVTVIPWKTSNLIEQVGYGTRPDIILEILGSFSERPIEGELFNGITQINIEYLSAENWTLDFHLKPSLTGKGKKFFYFLGFSEASGGLFFEKDYLSRQQLFMNNPKNIQHFIQQYGIHLNPERKNIFLFAYPSEVFEPWIETLNQIGIDYELWISDKEALKSISLNFIRKNQHIHILPMVRQTDFDQLLWLFDLLIVRGEDSFTRAQLTGLPFFWHIYPQNNQIHLQKLKAFWQLTEPYYDREIFFHQQRLSLELNQGLILTPAQRSDSWKVLFQYEQTWSQNTNAWRNFLFSQPSAYEKLTRFIKKQLE